LKGVRGEYESVLAMTCSFRFEVRPEDQLVELVAEHHTAHVCLECLTLLTVHRRIHHMRVEKVIVEMAEHRPVVAQG
jgi:hypothetical protein